MTTRIFLSESAIDAEKVSPGYTLSLDSPHSHYLKDVLRLKSGDPLIVVEPISEISFNAQIIDTASLTSIKIISKCDALNVRLPVETLLYPLTKGDTIELILEKGCELGVYSFIIWQSQRSVVRIQDDDAIEKKLIRWTKILQAAAQQSGKSHLPKLSYHKDLKSALRQLPPSVEKNSLRIVCSLSPEARPIREVMSDNYRAHIIVGPEGDFSPEEMSLLLDNHFHQASLGPFRLRTETAAISSVAIAGAIIGFTPANAKR